MFPFDSRVKGMCAYRWSQRHNQIVRGSSIAHYIPYAALVLVSFILMGVAWRREQNLKLVPLYLTISGFIYVFEYLILVLFRSYVYVPKILFDPYFDNILGATVSDGFIVPSVGICIAVFETGFWGIVFIAFAFVGVEEGFVYLNIYHHFWWNSGYTFIGLLSCFHLAKWIWRLLSAEPQKLWVQSMVLYLCNVVIQASTVFVLAAVFHLLKYHVGWYVDATRGHVAMAMLIVLVDSCVFTTVVLSRARFGWFVAVIIAVFLLNDALMNAGRLSFSGIWSEIVFIFVQAIVLYVLTRLRTIVVLQADGHNAEGY